MLKKASAKYFYFLAFILLLFDSNHATIHGQALVILRSPDIRSRFFVGAASRKYLGCISGLKPLTDWSNMFVFYQPHTTASVVDRQRFENYSNRLQDLSNLKRMIALLIFYTASDDPAAKIHSRCVVDEMVRWARTEALLNGIQNNSLLGQRQAVLENSWASVYFAQAYLIAAENGVLTRTDEAALDAWFLKLAEITRQEFSKKKRTRKWQWLDSLSNHRFWAGASIGMLSIPLQEKGAFSWSMAILRQGLLSVPKDGALPLEMGRGSRSLHYQSFAMTALGYMLKLADANSVSFSRSEEEKLAALATFSMAAYKEPNIVQRRTGYVQEKHPEMVNWVYAFEPHLSTTFPKVAARLREP